jgi:hypothetical protein
MVGRVAGQRLQDVTKSEELQRLLLFFDTAFAEAHNDVTRVDDSYQRGGFASPGQLPQGSPTVDKARLRENARIVRTLRDEAAAEAKKVVDRAVKEMLEKIEDARAKREKPNFEVDDQVSPLDAALHALLRNLAQAVLDLTEEIAGVIDQDLSPP